MSYDDTNYIDRNVMKGSCQVDSSGVYPNEVANDAPGQPVGTKFLAPGEDISSRLANRTRYQLAHNCDILKEPLDTMIAVTAVGALVGFSGSTIDIEPGGVGGDVNLSPSGHAYVGSSGYTGTGQEGRNTLFQFTDEFYNEVMVDGVEVIVAGVSPVIGNGFQNSTVTLTLNKSVPSGNYRLSYARDATLATLPDDALIRADIRGIHEAASESAYRSVRVCAVDNTLGPADYLGASAVKDALDAIIAAGGNATIFCRPGTYLFPASYDVSASNINIVGDSASGSGVIFDLSGGAYDLTVSGTDVWMESIRLAFTAGNGVRWAGGSGRMKYVYNVDGELELTGHVFTGEMLTVASTGVSVALTMDSAEDVVLVNSSFTAVDQSALYVTFCVRISMTNCKFLCGDATCFDLQDPLSYSTFLSCRFEAADGLALFFDQSDLIQVEFHSCYVKSTPATLASAGVVDVYVPTPGQTTAQFVLFSSCTFENPDGTVRYRNTAFRFISLGTDSAEELGIHMVNCGFRDDACGCEDGIGGGVAAAFLRGVHMEGCIFNFANQASLVEDGPLLEAYNCYAIRCGVYAHQTPSSVAVVSRAAVELYRGCEFYSLRLLGGNGDWNRPFLLIEGDTASPDPAAVTPTRRASMVDGLEVNNHSATYWDNVVGGGALVADVGEHGILRRFVWSENNVAGLQGTSGLPYCLVKPVGERAEVSFCHMIIGSATAAPYLQHFIATVDLAYDWIMIKDNYFQHYDGRAATRLMRSVIRIDGTTSGDCKGGIISNNRLSWLGGDASPSPVSAALISSTGNVYMWRVVNNTIYVRNLTASPCVVYWECTPDVFPAGAGGTNAGGAIIQGNTVLNDDNSGGGPGTGPSIQPTIWRATSSAVGIVGIADNVLGTN